jgi:hypothetical protein
MARTYKKTLKGRWRIFDHASMSYYRDSDLQTNIPGWLTRKKTAATRSGVSQDHAGSSIHLASLPYEILTAIFDKVIRSALACIIFFR